MFEERDVHEKSGKIDVPAAPGAPQPPARRTQSTDPPSDWQTVYDLGQLLVSASELTPLLNEFFAPTIAEFESSYSQGAWSRRRLPHEGPGTDALIVMVPTSKDAPQFRKTFQFAVPGCDALTQTVFLTATTTPAGSGPPALTAAQIELGRRVRFDPRGQDTLFSPAAGLAVPAAPSAPAASSAGSNPPNLPGPPADALPANPYQAASNLFPAALTTNTRMIAANTISAGVGVEQAASLALGGNQPRTTAWLRDRVDARGISEVCVRGGSFVGVGLVPTGTVCQVPCQGSERNFAPFPAKNALTCTLQSVGTGTGWLVIRMVSDRCQTSVTMSCHRRVMSHIG